MGNEASCTIQFGKQRFEGKALLETSEVLFRGDFRLRIPFSAVKSAKVVDGELRLQTAEGLAVFHLGAAAEKWCDKILHPKSRMEKLGVKAGARGALFGEVEPEFLHEVMKLTETVNRGTIEGNSGGSLLEAY